MWADQAGLASEILFLSRACDLQITWQGRPQQGPSVGRCLPSPCSCARFAAFALKGVSSSDAWLEFGAPPPVGESPRLSSCTSFPWRAGTPGCSVLLGSRFGEHCENVGWEGYQETQATGKPRKAAREMVVRSCLSFFKARPPVGWGLEKSTVTNYGRLSQHAQGLP